MKYVLLPVMWRIKNACWRIAVKLSKLEYTILDRIDAIDPHYADKQWGKIYSKSKGVK